MSDIKQIALRAEDSLTTPFDPEKHLPERGWAYTPNDTQDFWKNGDRFLYLVDGAWAIDIGFGATHPSYHGPIPTPHFFDLLCEALNIKP